MEVEVKIKNVQDYLMAILPYQQKAFAQIHRFGLERPALLFRGKKQKKSLRAGIAEFVVANDVSRQISFERERLALLKRQLGIGGYSDWDIVALAQHHGIATRFLDWTSNSLTALFFALGETNTPYEDNDMSEVWLLETVESDFEIPEEERSPIPEKKGSRTVIFTPQLIDSRISAQDSYLMRQVYEHCDPDDSKRLVIRSVDVNLTFADRVYKIPITNDEVTRFALLHELKKYGYCESSIMPDADNWKHINWKHLKKQCDELSQYYKSNKGKKED